MKSGLILVDKPEGISSAQVVSTARKRLGIKKIGHAGTLDPMATGLLVLLTNKATRLARYAEGGTKIYSGTIRLGVRSDTDDITGTLSYSDASLPDFAAVSQAASEFTGLLEQIPPTISAVKIAGKRAYARARNGESFSIQSRQVTVDTFEVSPVGTESIAFRIVCSKGTYIRSLARDLGEVLGVGACLDTLRRECSYPFSVADAVSLEELTPDAIVNWDILFPEEARVSLSREQCDRLLQGDIRPLSELRAPEESSRLLYCSTSTQQPVGLLEKTDDSWKIAVNLGA